MLISFERLYTIIAPPVLAAATMGSCGVLGGLVYAKLADLPPFQAAKYWAIYCAAAGALQSAANSCIENARTKKFVLATLSLVTGTCFISVMQHQGLMGLPMMSVLAAVHLVGIAALFRMPDLDAPTG